MSTFKSEMKTGEDVMSALNRTGAYKNADPKFEKKKNKKEEEDKKQKPHLTSSSRKDLDRIFMM